MAPNSGGFNDGEACSLGADGRDVLGIRNSLAGRAGVEMTAARFGYGNKYKAKPADGFGSQLEKAVFIRLKDREVLGLIRDIKRQQSVMLEDLKNGEKRLWKVDFSYVDCETGATCYAEAKGFETNDYIRKRNMWRRNSPARLEIWRGSHRSPKVVEVIDPKGGEK